MLGIQVASLFWLCEPTGRLLTYYTEKLRTSIDASKEVDLQVKWEKSV
jgi:hypothetical protein